MKVLITGGNGVIGRALAEDLFKLRSKFEVYSIDRTTSNSNGNFDRYYQLDLIDNECISKLYENFPSIDVVVHLAASLNMDNDNSDTILTNCIGTLNLIKYAKLANCKRFIYISSVPVIGKPLILPITESHPTHPFTTYHATKLFGENLLFLSSNQTLNPIVLRITSPAGEGSHENTILPTFIKLCKANQDIYLSGTGNRKQNYIHIRDIVQAIILSVSSLNVGLFNLAARECYSNLELAKLCILMTNSNSEIRFNDLEDEHDDYVWDVDINKLRQSIGFEPSYGIEDIIRSMI